jgi:prephenate dehydratase
MKRAAHTRIAFQGERGAFSEEAALKLLGADIALVPCGTFDATFAAIEDGVADYVLAPMENSLAGSVHRSFDLLVESGLHIVGEVIIPIAHNLIAMPGATFEGLTSVASSRIGAVRTVFHRASCAKANRSGGHRWKRPRHHARGRQTARGHRKQACG